MRGPADAFGVLGKAHAGVGSFGVLGYGLRAFRFKVLGLRLLGC